MKWEQGGIQFNAGTKRENLEGFPAQVQNTVHNNEQHTAHVHNAQYTVHCAHVDCNEHCPGAPLVQSFPWLKLCRSYNGPTAMTFWTSMRSIRADLAEDLCWSAGRRLLRRWRRILMHGGEGGKTIHHTLVQCSALVSPAEVRSCFAGGAVSRNHLWGLVCCTALQPQAHRALWIGRGELDKKGSRTIRMDF